MNPTSQASSQSPDGDTDGPITFEKVWLMFKETDKKFKETDKKFQETHRLLAQQSEETDRKIKETTDQVKETSREITRVERQFTSMWGKFVESLVEGDLIRLLNEKGISVNSTHQRTTGRKKNLNFEFDIIAENGHEVVVVEVKTTLKSDAITHFLSKLEKFKEWLPSYQEKTVYGAVAFIHTEDNVITHAERCGLFIIKATGNSAKIINGNEFIPKNY